MASLAYLDQLTPGLASSQLVQNGSHSIGIHANHVLAQAVHHIRRIPIFFSLLLLLQLLFWLLMLLLLAVGHLDASSRHLSIARSGARSADMLAAREACACGVLPGPSGHHSDDL